MADLAPPNVERRSYAKIPLTVAQMFAEENLHGPASSLKVDVTEDKRAFAWVVRAMTEHLASIPKEDSWTEGEDQWELPDGWAQAVLDRFAPQWWKRRWPIRMRNYTKCVRVRRTVYERLCPHVAIPATDRPGERVHFQFLDGIPPVEETW